MTKKEVILQKKATALYFSSNPKDHKNEKFNTWDKIFEFQGRKDGANYTLLKNWLKKYCDVPKLKKNK